MSEWLKEHAWKAWAPGCAMNGGSAGRCTPRYTPWEQLLAQPLDARADLFAARHQSLSCTRPAAPLTR